MHLSAIIAQVSRFPCDTNQPVDRTRDPVPRVVTQAERAVGEGGPDSTVTSKWSWFIVSGC